ncbi:MAG: chemotaxis protein CheC [Anaerolineales bacterium]
MNESQAQPSKLQSLLSALTAEGMHNAARAMTQMVGETFTVTDPNITSVKFTDIPEIFGGPENVAVGIYLRIEGNISGQIMLIVPYNKALELTDLIMGEPIGTTQSLGKMERSALAELGNLTGSFFLNAIADSSGVHVRPTPPAVMVDMVGAIMDIILATSDITSEEVLLIQAKFVRNGKETQADFWIIPDQITLDTLTEKANQDYEG